MVKSITEKCSAKINIAIDVLGKYPNDYHEVRMIMTQVGIFDVITISLKDEKGIEIAGSDINMPVDESNLAWKAANEFFKAIKFDGGCDIYRKAYTNGSRNGRRQFRCRRSYKRVK